MKYFLRSGQTMSYSSYIFITTRLIAPSMKYIFSQYYFLKHMQYALGARWSAVFIWTYKAGTHPIANICRPVSLIRGLCKIRNTFMLSSLLLSASCFSNSCLSFWDSTKFLVQSPPSFGVFMCSMGLYPNDAFSSDCVMLIPQLARLFSIRTSEILWSLIGWWSNTLALVGA